MQSIDESRATRATPFLYFWKDIKHTPYVVSNDDDYTRVRRQRDLDIYESWVIEGSN